MWVGRQEGEVRKGKHTKQDNKTETQQSMLCNVGECGRGPYYVQHEVVPQAGSTVDADQDALLQGGAEAHGQPVRAGAGPLVGRPHERDEASALPEDVRCPSWRRRGEGRQVLPLNVCIGHHG